MKAGIRYLHYLPLIVTLGLGFLMALHGPIAQPSHYHHFADARAAWGLPNAADVLSNLGFAAAGLWGWICCSNAHNNDDAGVRSPGYRLFLLALLLTAAGSFYYHLQPDDARLVWDRIPIALACAGLLAAVHGETTGSTHVMRNAAVLAIAAVWSVVWWNVSGDLRPYLLMQALPLILIPLWQWIHGAARSERLAFGVAILLYVLAKLTELHDHEILAMSGSISGHTLKHLLATVAAFVIVSVLVKRTKPVSQ
ncbi:MAG TPA: hypothetical protein VEC35_18185 [Noviherbaspirillum sp.]|nr:hypothetical protein [Noviherbaspirillum sp.]